MTKTKLLTGASALVAASLAFAGVAQATVASTSIYGGGSSLVAPYIREAGDCYGVQVPLVSQGTVLTGATANETTKTYPLFVSPGNVALTCAGGGLNPSVTVNYISAGSGPGIAAFYGHDAATFWGDTVPGTTPSPYPTVTYAASDAGLSATDVDIYNNGGTEGSGANTAVVVAPNVTPGAGQYVNPRQAYGAMIQIPLLVAPVDLAYSSVYKAVADGSGNVAAYKFNLKKKNADGSGGLVLDVPTVCAIFNGQITNWNDPALKALNGGLSLMDPTDPVGAAGWTATGLPIEMVGRSDSSGTTSIFYRALAAQCSGTYTEGGHSITYANAYGTAGGKTLPTGLVGNTYSSSNPNNGPTAVAAVLGKYTVAKGSGAVAKYLSFPVQSVDATHLTSYPPAGSTYTQGRLGYLGPDFVLPHVTVTTANTYGLNIVDIKVGTTLIEPTPGNALKAFSAAVTLPPQSTSIGAYTTTVASIAPASHGNRNAPQDWVEPISTTEVLSDGFSGATPLANPTAAGAYPFVGTTDGFVYTCYSDATVAAQVKAFFNYYLTNKTINTSNTGLIAEAGFGPLPSAWTKAINQTFFTPTTKGTAPVLATDALNLNILQAGSGPVSGTGSQCKAITPGA